MSSLRITLFTCTSASCDYVVAVKDNPMKITPEGNRCNKCLVGTMTEVKLSNGEWLHITEESKRAD